MRITELKHISDYPKVPEVNYTESYLILAAAAIFLAMFFSVTYFVLGMNSSDVFATDSGPRVEQVQR